MCIVAWSGQAVAAVAGRRLERGVRPHRQREMVGRSRPVGIQEKACHGGNSGGAGKGKEESMRYAISADGLCPLRLSRYEDYGKSGNPRQREGISFAGPGAAVPTGKAVSHSNLHGWSSVSGCARTNKIPAAPGPERL